MRDTNRDFNLRIAHMIITYVKVLFILGGIAAAIYFGRGIVYSGITTASTNMHTYLDHCMHGEQNGEFHIFEGFDLKNALSPENIKAADKAFSKYVSAEEDAKSESIESEINEMKDNAQNTLNGFFAKVKS